MDSLEKTCIADLPDVPLATLFSFLDTKTLLSARLVCRRWSSLTLSSFPAKICISTGRFAEIRTPEVVENQLKDFNANIFRCIRYHNVSSSPAHTKRRKVNMVWSCLKHIGANQNINYICLSGAAELESLVPIVNNHGLPNLATIISHYFFNSEDHQFTSKFLPGSLSSLKTLKQCSSSPPTATPAAKIFIQSLISASPNLEKLTGNFFYDLGYQKKLKRLKICYPPNDPAFLAKMLSQVAKSLQFLTLFNLPFTTSLPLPMLPNLTKLHIFHYYRVFLLFPNISIAAPNIKLFKFVSPEGEDHSLTKYLQTKPANIQELQLYCCSYPSTSTAHDWFKHMCSNLLSPLPNLKVLKVLGRCLLGRDSLQLDIVHFLLNFDCPYLIFECGYDQYFNHDWVSQFIRGIMSWNVIKKEGGRKGMIELAVCKQRTEVEHLEEDVMQDFTSAMIKLSQRWDRVRFKHLMISSSQLETLQYEIITNNLPVDLFYAFGQRADDTLTLTLTHTF